MSLRVATGPRRGYSDVHPGSPIALGFEHAGPVHVPADRADIGHAVGRKDLQRAYGLGICSATRGLAPDVHQVATGLWISEIAHPADYLARWISTGLQWARNEAENVAGPACNPDEAEQYEAARLAQIDQYAAELVAVGPVWFVDWIGRTVHPPKWAYLVEMGAQVWLGAGVPRDPQADWVGKVNRQWARRVASGEHVDAVVRELEQF